MFLQKDRDWVGIIYGIALPIVAFALFLLLADKGIKISPSFSDIICLGSTLPVFYYYLNRGMYRTVRGILIMVIFWAIVYIIRFKFS